MLCQEKQLQANKTWRSWICLSDLWRFLSNFLSFFTSQKSSWIHRVIARAGRFPWIEFWQVLKRRVIWRWVVGGFDRRSFRFGCRLFTPKSCFESFCLSSSSPEKKEWKHDVNMWKSFQHLPWKLTCPMKNSGWTTFDPLFREHALVLGWKKVALRRAQDAASAIDLGNAVTWVPSPTAPPLSHGHRWQTRGGFETNNFPGIWVFFWLGCAC